MSPPTLDPNQKHEVRTLINEMSRDKIIVISTHILEKSMRLQRAIIIARGRIVAETLRSRSRRSHATTTP